MRWFRVNIINDAGNPSSATVGRRLTETYMRITLKIPNPTEEQMKAELSRIFREEKSGGELINTTQKFSDFLLTAIEDAAAVR